MTYHPHQQHTQHTLSYQNSESYLKGENPVANNNLIVSNNNSYHNLESKHNQDYLKHIRFQTEDIYNHSSNEEKHLSIHDDDETHYGGSCNSGDNSKQHHNVGDLFVSSKSMPNIPKVSN